MGSSIKVEELEDIDSKIYTKRKELNTISDAVNEAVKLAKQYTTTEGQVKESKSKLSKIESQLVEKTDTLVDLQKKKDALISTQSSLTGDIKRLGDVFTEKGKTIVILETAISEKTKQLSELESKKVIATEELSSEKERLQAKILTITTTRNKLSSKLDKINADLDASSKRFISLQEEVLFLENLVPEMAGSIKTKEGELSTIGLKILASKSELDLLRRQIIAKRKELDEITEKKEKIWEAREVELSAREGSLSKQKSWLEEKTVILKRTKGELEKFYGREITNVKF